MTITFNKMNTTDILFIRSYVTFVAGFKSILIHFEPVDF